MNTTRVVFFLIKDIQTKLSKILEISKYHFHKKEHFLIQVSDEKAAHYVDQLLWNHPKKGFIPHLITTTPVNDYIVITHTKKNLNHAKSVFNLCPTPILVDESYRVIYEMEDMTTPNKQMLARQRFEAYKQADYVIESQL